MNYHQQSPEQVLEHLKSSAQGLSGQEAGQRLAKYGPNKLAEGKKVTHSEIARSSSATP